MLIVNNFFLEESNSLMIDPGLDLLFQGTPFICVFSQYLFLLIQIGDNQRNFDLILEILIEVIQNQKIFLLDSCLLIVLKGFLVFSCYLGYVLERLQVQNHEFGVLIK